MSRREQLLDRIRPKLVCTSCRIGLDDPAAHVAEMLRVRRLGGRVHCVFPFMQAFQASPHDYTRFTIPGRPHLFEDFTNCETRVAGPTSGLPWILQEWLAIAASFGSERLWDHRAVAAPGGRP